MLAPAFYNTFNAKFSTCFLPHGSTVLGARSTLAAPTFPLWLQQTLTRAEIWPLYGALQNFTHKVACHINRWLLQQVNKILHLPTLLSIVQTKKHIDCSSWIQIKQILCCLCMCRNGRETLNWSRHRRLRFFVSCTLEHLGHILLSVLCLVTILRQCGNFPRCPAVVLRPAATCRHFGSFRHPVTE